MVLRDATNNIHKNDHQKKGGNTAKTTKFKPWTWTIDDYRGSIRSWAESGREDAAQCAEDALRSMIESYNEEKTSVRPDGCCFNTVIFAHALAGDADRAEAVLELMGSEYEAGNLLAEPNFKVYTTVLSAWEKSNDPYAPERCDEILDHMHHLHESGALQDCKPDVFTYTAIMHCWAKSNRNDAAKRTENLFRRMTDRYEAGDMDYCPDNLAYACLLNSFVKSTDSVRAEEILWEMVNAYIHGNEKAKPSARNFNTVLAMLANEKSEDASERAENIVRRLIELNAKNVFSVKPDEFSFSLLLKSWFNSPREDAADRVEASLLWMNKLHKAGHEAARLDIIKYSTCITVLAESCHEPKRAEVLLRRMCDDYLKGNHNAKPPRRCFNIVMAAWSRFSDVKAQDAAKGAHGLFSFMLETYESIHVDPDAYAYEMVITCWAKGNEILRADSMLHEMIRVYNLGKLNQAPKQKTFQTIISAWQATAGIPTSEKIARVTHLRKAMDSLRKHGRSRASTDSNGRY